MQVLFYSFLYLKAEVDDIQTWRRVGFFIWTRETFARESDSSQLRPNSSHFQGRVRIRQFKASSLNRFSIKPNPGMLKPGEEIIVSVYVHREVQYNQRRSFQTCNLSRSKSSTGSSSTLKLKTSLWFWRTGRRRTNWIWRWWSRRKRIVWYRLEIIKEKFRERDGEIQGTSFSTGIRQKIKR